MNVYVAAAFGDAPRVLELHARLEALGFTPTSSWVRHSTGEPEDLESMSPAKLADVIEENDRGVESADVVIVLASAAAKETYCEAARALGGAPGTRLVLWVGGPRPLSAYRAGVERFSSVEMALAWLSGWARVPADRAHRVLWTPATRD